MKARKSVQFWFPNLGLIVQRPQQVGASSIAECGLQIADWKGGVTDVEFGRVWSSLVEPELCNHETYEPHEKG